MSLQHNDLKDLVDNILEIDSYKSKMGSDKDIVTVAFATKTKESADDLAAFIERGYTFVLDADATAGEQADGTYKVFVEIQRDDGVGEQIMELANGIENLTGMDDVKFRYHKEFRSKSLTLEELTGAIPTDPDLYGVDSEILSDMSESMNNYTNFFNKSMVENVTMWGNMLTIKKAWADPVAFKFVEFGPTVETLNNISESFNINGFSEIIFLTKYIGDYNITKYGNKLTFENNEQTLVLERIIL
jgi:hypothetical protein|tara:strand:- start:305 stop:1039 length:735 start_codon:yes stop_codon:yes gene_type:complete